MNLIVEVASPGDPLRVECVDGVRSLGPWKSREVATEAHRVRVALQCIDGVSPKTCGLIDCHGHIAAWTGCSPTVGRALEKKLRHHPATLLRYPDAIVGDVGVLVVIDKVDLTVTWYRNRFGLVPSMYAIEQPGRLWIATCLCQFSPDATNSATLAMKRVGQYIADVPDTSDADFFKGVRRLKPGRTARLAAKTRIVMDIREPLPPPVLPEMGVDEFLRDARHGLSERITEELSESRCAVVAMSSGLDSGMVAGLARSLSATGKLIGATMSLPSFPEVDETRQTTAMASELGLELHCFNVEREPPLARTSPYQQFWGYGPCFHPGETYESAFWEWVQRELNPDLVLTGWGAEILFPAKRQDVFELAWRRWYLLPSLKRSAVVARAFRRWAQRYPSKVLISELGRALLSTSSWLCLRQLRDKVQRHRRQASSGLVTLQAVYAASRAAELPTFETRLDSWRWEMTVRMNWRRRLRTASNVSPPFLSTRFYRTATRVPLDFYLRGDTIIPAHRPVVGRLAAGVVPEELRALPKRGLFDAFIESSLHDQSGIAREYLQRATLSKSGLVDYSVLQCALTALARAPENRCDVKDLPSTWQLWRVLSSELWLDAAGGCMP